MQAERDRQRTAYADLASGGTASADEVDAAHDELHAYEERVYDTEQECAPLTGSRSPPGSDRLARQRAPTSSDQRGGVVVRPDPFRHDSRASNAAGPRRRRCGGRTSFSAYATAAARATGRPRGAARPPAAGLARCCRARLGRTDGWYGSANDVAQEVFTGVPASLAAWSEPARPFGASAYGITAHKVADAQQTACRDRTAPTAQVPKTTDRTAVRRRRRRRRPGPPDPRAARPAPPAHPSCCCSAWRPA